MFANIAVAFLISLGIALVLCLVVKGVYSRFDFQALHILVAVLAIAGSTVAGTVAITSGKALNYTNSLAVGAKSLAGQAAEIAGIVDIPASEMADGYVEGAAELAKSKLSRTRTLSVAVMGVMNLLLALFLFNAGSKARSAKRHFSAMDDLDDLDEFGGSSKFDDLELD